MTDQPRGELPELLVVCHGMRRKGESAVIGVIPNKIAERPPTWEKYVEEFEEVPLVLASDAKQAVAAAEARAEGDARDAAYWRQVAPFVCAVMEDWWEGDLDGGTRQDLAEHYGLIVGREVTEPCGDDCRCEEYGLPATCFKRTGLLLAAITAQEAERGDE